MSFPILTALFTVGTALEAIGQYQAGQARKSEAEYNARVAQLQAEQIKRSAELEEYKLRRQKEATLGKQRALYAKAGLSLEGTPLEVLADTASQYELDIATARYNALVGQQRALSESAFQRNMARQYGRQGVLGAGSTLLTRTAQWGLMNR